MSHARKQKKQQPDEAPGPEWVSLNESTKLLGLNREAVLQLGIARTLRVERFGRWTFVSRASINAYLATTANT